MKQKAKGIKNQVKTTKELTPRDPNRNTIFVPVATEKPESEIQNALKNGLSDAVGFGSANPFGGQGGFPGGFSGQQVEDSTTIFENLRWYLVSNFRQMLSQAFAEIGLVQTIVCVPVDDGLRGGVLIKSKQLDEDQIKKLQSQMKRKGDFTTAGWAAKWERLYGGAGIIVMVDDQDPEEPFKIASVNKNTELGFRDCDMWELFQDKQNVEGFSIEEEESEYFDYYNEPVHKSRVMKLEGLKAPSFIRPRLRGWGMSVVEALVRSMNQYLKATDLGFEVLDEFKLDIYKIKNMVNTLLSPNGTAKLKERIQLANWQKNYQNAVVMDSEDDFDHKQLSFAGLAEAMEGIRMQVAADMRMPILKLFGQSVTAGLGTSAPEEMENYNSMIESEVRGKLEYHILRMAEIRSQQLFGMVPDDLELEFKPLRELGAVDQETVKTQKYARVSAAKAAGEITTIEYRDICNKGNLFDIQLDTTDAALNDPELGTDDETEESKDGEGDDDDSNNDDKSGEDAPSKAPVKNDILTFNEFDRFKRFFNSPAFDKASYEADGGDAWINPGRKEIFSDPMNVDEGLWRQAKVASRAALGEERWQFVVWWYKKQGGKF